MKSTNSWLIAFLGISLLLTSIGVHADKQFRAPANEGTRYLVVISDLHMGLGKVGSQWHPYEDFRWPKALKSLLDEVSRLGKDRVDLVIAGDFLELWQRPDDIACKGQGAGLGCTVEEMVRVTQRVIKAHSGVDAGSPRAFDSLRAFSQRGENRIYLLPGNHDAALLIPSVWALVAEALNEKSGRVKFIGASEEGRWTTANGRIVVEHGHQMGADLNKYDQWPTVLDNDKGLMIRVEGELNVQRLFNGVERKYPIIDNLSPEVRGAWYRAQDRGALGTIADIGKLLVFMLFETSIEQKKDLLGHGPTPDAQGNIRWDPDYARQTLGYKLFAYALPPDDTIRVALLAEPANENSVKLRHELTQIAQDPRLSNSDIQHLCDQLALRGELRCWDPEAGAVAEALFSSRYRVERDHLRERIKQYPQMKVFIYGHTHQFEVGHNVEVDDITPVTVFNSGAFQRVMDDDDYRRKLEESYPGLSAADGLSKLTLEDDFKPCYTVVMGSVTKDKYDLELKRWYMPENGSGDFVSATDPRCIWAVPVHR